MAFEQKDLDALTQWGEQRAAIEQRKAEETLCPEPVKTSFWAGLLGVLFSGCGQVERSNENISINDTPLNPLDSHYSVSHYERNNGMYSAVTRNQG